MPRTILDLTGHRFGCLVAIAKSDNSIDESGTTRTNWQCKCTCGKIVIKTTRYLRRHKYISCGKSCGNFKGKY